MTSCRPIAPASGTLPTLVFSRCEVPALMLTAAPLRSWGMFLLSTGAVKYRPQVTGAKPLQFNCDVWSMTSKTERTWQRPWVSCAAPREQSVLNSLPPAPDIRLGFFSLAVYTCPSRHPGLGSMRIKNCYTQTWADRTSMLAQASCVPFGLWPSAPMKFQTASGAPTFLPSTLECIRPAGVTSGLTILGVP